VCLCYDVGCNGNASDKIQGYRFHGLHGRVIPFAVGAKLANMKVPVIAFGGDGATFSEGIGHLVHALRSIYPITFVLHKHTNYALTTGQASSLTWQGQPMNASPNGIPERTLASMEFIFSLQPPSLHAVLAETSS
jgi:2-oxoglutarate/2-oxoacid ferredoxin oxidoreductase subunit beta